MPVPPQIAYPHIITLCEDCYTKHRQLTNQIVVVGYFTKCMCKCHDKPINPNKTSKVKINE